MTGREHAPVWYQLPIPILSSCSTGPDGTAVRSALLTLLHYSRSVYSSKNSQSDLVLISFTLLPSIPSPCTTTKYKTSCSLEMTLGKTKKRKQKQAVKLEGTFGNNLQRLHPIVFSSSILILDGSKKREGNFTKTILHSRFSDLHELMHAKIQRTTTRCTHTKIDQTFVP